MTTLLDALASLPPWLVLVLVFVLPAAEASIFVGVVIPGETAVLIGGVVANDGDLLLWTVIVAAIAGAACGDQVGFLLGRRYGTAVMDRVPDAISDHQGTQSAMELIRKRGAWAVVLGRWAAVLRAFVPGLAGASGMRHATFTWANLAGGAVWGTVIAVLGYLAGASYHRLEDKLGYASDIIVAVVVVAVVALVVVRRVRAHREGPGTR